jgi:hypothetical protein
MLNRSTVELAIDIHNDTQNESERAQKQEAFGFISLISLSVDPSLLSCVASLAVSSALRLAFRVSSLQLHLSSVVSSSLPIPVFISKHQNHFQFHQISRKRSTTMRSAIAHLFAQWCFRITSLICGIRFVRFVRWRFLCKQQVLHFFARMLVASALRMRMRIHIHTLKCEEAKAEALHYQQHNATASHQTNLADSGQRHAQ